MTQPTTPDRPTPDDVDPRAVLRKVLDNVSICPLCSGSRSSSRIGPDNDPYPIRHTDGCELDRAIKSAPSSDVLEHVVAAIRNPLYLHQCSREDLETVARAAIAAVPSSDGAGMLRAILLHQTDENDWAWLERRLGYTSYGIHWRGVISCIRAALATKPAPNSVGQRPGWKLVPIEPTEAMTDAGRAHINGYEDTAYEVWQAMLAAAPDQPTEQGGEER